MSEKKSIKDELEEIEDTLWWLENEEKKRIRRMYGKDYENEEGYQDAMIKIQKFKNKLIKKKTKILKQMK